MVALLGQTLRYGTVGIGVTAVYLGLASALAFAGVGAGAASVLAYFVSTSLSYVGHRRYTFRSAAEHARAVPRFVLLSGVGLALAAAIPLAVERWTALGPYVGFVFVTVMVAAVSFAGLRLAVFRVADDAGLVEGSR